MVTLLRHECLSPSQPWWKMIPNAIKWAPETSVYLFQIFQLMRKQIWAPCPGGFAAKLSGSTLGMGIPDLLLLPPGPRGTHSLSKFLISRNPITHMGHRGLTPADTFIVLALPASHPLSHPSQPSLSAGLPPTLSSFCVAPGKKLPLMDSTDPWPHFEVSTA